MRFVDLPYSRKLDVLLLIRLMVYWAEDEETANLIKQTWTLWDFVTDPGNRDFRIRYVGHPGTVVAKYVAYLSSRRNVETWLKRDLPSFAYTFVDSLSIKDSNLTRAILAELNCRLVEG